MMSEFSAPGVEGSSPAKPFAVPSVPRKHSSGVRSARAGSIALSPLTQLLEVDMSSNPHEVIRDTVKGKPQRFGEYMTVYRQLLDGSSVATTGLQDVVCYLSWCNYAQGF